MIKYHFIFDKTKKSLKFKKKFLKKYKNFNPTLCKVIIVFGGDGFMLQVLKKYQKYKKPFYGVNMGTYGFLMNKFNSFDINKNIAKAKLFTITPLEMRATTQKNKVFKAIAVNEISLFRQSRQTASLQLKVGKKVLLKKLLCDGVLIATPAGSTAYNLSVNGPILSLDSKKLAITSISPFRPRRWKGKIVTSSSIIKISNLNIKKRTVSAVADNIEVKNVKSVSVKVNKSIKFKLFYDKNNSLTKKIKLEQRRKMNI
tara:strand:- start:3763 stop:4533 length:771 start_codon:yes stop_codon:yes gene_type:complete